MEELLKFVSLLITIFFDAQFVGILVSPFKCAYFVSVRFFGIN